jgi:hypothetical protein
MARPGYAHFAGLNWLAIVNSKDNEEDEKHEKGENGKTKARQRQYVSVPS